MIIRSVSWWTHLGSSARARWPVVAQACKQSPRRKGALVKAAGERRPRGARFAVGQLPHRCLKLARRVELCSVRVLRKARPHPVQLLLHPWSKRGGRGLVGRCAGGQRSVHFGPPFRPPRSLVTDSCCTNAEKTKCKHSYLSSDSARRVACKANESIQHRARTSWLDGRVCGWPLLTHPCKRRAPGALCAHRPC
jgi:hypothetical protein